MPYLAKIASTKKVKKQFRLSLIQTNGPCDLPHSHLFQHLTGNFGNLFTRFDIKAAIKSPKQQPGVINVNRKEALLFRYRDEIKQKDVVPPQWLVFDFKNNQHMPLRDAHLRRLSAICFIVDLTSMPSLSTSAQKHHTVTKKANMTIYLDH